MTSILSPNYDAFLFAPVYESADGMQTSVLSAFARLDIDPWKETARLAEMSQTDAEDALASNLQLVFGPKNQEPTGRTLSAAQLIDLLHHSGKIPAASLVESQRGQYFWLVWMSVAIAMSAFSTQHSATLAPNDKNAPKVNVAPQGISSSVKNPLPAKSE